MYWIWQLLPDKRREFTERQCGRTPEVETGSGHRTCPGRYGHVKWLHSSLFIDLSQNSVMISPYLCLQSMLAQLRYVRMRSNPEWHVSRLTSGLSAHFTQAVDFTLLSDYFRVLRSLPLSTSPGWAQAMRRSVNGKLLWICKEMNPWAHAPTQGPRHLVSRSFRQAQKHHVHENVAVAALLSFCRQSQIKLQFLRVWLDTDVTFRKRGTISQELRVMPKVPLWALSFPICIVLFSEDWEIPRPRHRYDTTVTLCPNLLTPSQYCPGITEKREEFFQVHVPSKSRSTRSNVRHTDQVNSIRAFA